MISNSARVGRETTGTWSLLRWGVVAGPFYLTVGLAQALLREGFDLARHPLSVLANGPGGWVQTANFVLTGLMVLVAASGFARALGPGSRAVTWFLAGYGLAMIGGAIFTADPVDGFPPGTPEGLPTSISTTGLLHFAAGGLGFLCLALSGFAAAWTLRRRGASSLALLSLLSGLTVVLGFLSGMVFPPGMLGIWIAVVVGWIWLAVMSLGLKRLV
jgi:Protein of unknown function (DUF998)